MMNRFKFRVWDNKTQSYKYKFDLTDGCYELDYIFNGMKYNEECSMYPSVGIDKNDFGIIEQCTGLKDKNGKLIYESDLVKVLYDINSPEKIATVKWLKEDACFSLVVSLDEEHALYGNMLEIIGNIHEEKTDVE